MDILELFSTFTEANMSQESFNLYLDGANSLQCFASEDADALKHILKYLKNNLSKSKSCPKKPLLLLQSVVHQCAGTNIFVENCLQWIDSLQKILKINANAEVLGLACDISTDLIFYLDKNPELSRKFSSMHLANLITTLLVTNNKIQINLLQTLRQCMEHFPGSCRQFRNDIEQFLLSLIAHEDISTIKEAAACLVLLPSLGSVGDQGSYSVKMWQALLQKILGSLYTVVCKILKRLGVDENLWDLKELQTLNLPVIEDTVPILVLQKSFKMYCSLCLCLIEMLSSHFHLFVDVPVRTILGFLCTVLMVSPKDLGGRKTTEDLMLLAVLPSLQSMALDVFQELINCCGRHLIQYSGIIVNLLLQLLESTKIQKNWTGTIKPYSDIRQKIYEIIQTWATTSTSASGFEKFSDRFFANIFLDLKVLNNSSVASALKVNSIEPSAKKRKLLANNLAIETGSHKKNIPIVNSDLNKAAVKALKCMMLAIGPTLSHSQYMNASSKIIQIIQDIHCKFSCIQSPYEDPKYRQQLFATLLTIVTIPSRESMPPMHTALGLFQRGLQNEDQHVKAFCLEAINTCASILHPRTSHPRTFLSFSDPPKNFIDKSMEDDKITNTYESKESQTTIDFINIACSPIPTVQEEPQKEPKDLRVLQVVEAEPQQSSILFSEVDIDAPSNEVLQVEETPEHKNQNSALNEDEMSNEDVEMNEPVHAVNLSTQTLRVNNQDVEDKKDEDSEKILNMLESFVDADPD